MNQYREITKCRCCKSTNLHYLFSLGNQWLIDFPDPEHGKDGILCPLELMMCKDCKFIQLGHTIDQNDIYGRAMYWYKSGVNATMRAALKDVVDKGISLVNLEPGDSIIDIGSNDGTLAAFYPDDIKKIGFEPSINVWQESNSKINWYKNYNEFFAYKGEQAKIITSCAMFYDLDDPTQFLEDIKKSLLPDGIWINQMNYLGTMIENKTFDNISHEHLGYYSFYVFSNLLNKHDLEIFDVEINDINGGSFRCYIRHAGTGEKTVEAEKRVAAIRNREIGANLNHIQTYLNFYDHSLDVAKKLTALIKQIKLEGKSIYIYGASTRGQVIIQFCGLDHALIDGCAERNPDKYGKVTIGTEIPIYDEDYVRMQNPDYMLVLPYSFIDEFIKREADYLKAGGRFIVPLPNVQIIDSTVRKTQL